MFIYVPYTDRTAQHECYPLPHPRLSKDFVIVPWEKKRQDGIPIFEYGIFHYESGSIVGWGDSPESAMEDAVRLLDEKGHAFMEAFYQEHRDRAREHERANEEYRERLIAEARNQPSTRTGAIYLIKSAGRYKLGQSVNPEQRIGSMTLSEKPEILVIHHCSAWKEAERELHLRFAHKRGHGEWFDFSKDELIEVEKAMRAFK
jgi:hypothetical protein